MKAIFTLFKYLWVLISGLAIVFVVLIFLFEVILGKVCMEWVDPNGCGNGYVHTIYDDEKWPIVHFRLSNFSSTNQTYSLSIKQTMLYHLRDWVCMSRYNCNRLEVANNSFALKRLDKMRICDVELPVDFIPTTEGEVLVIDFYICNDDKCDERQSRISMYLTSKKVRYSFSH